MFGSEKENHMNINIDFSSLTSRSLSLFLLKKKNLQTLKSIDATHTHKFKIKYQENVKKVLGGV